MKAVIVGLQGPHLLPEEARLLRAYPPAGVILFGRNIEGPQGLMHLVGDLREGLHPTSLLVDQEGGRVARLRPPGWRAHPPAAAIGAGWAADPVRTTRLAFVTGALLGLDCAEAGFDVVCAPVLDLMHHGTTPAIGDRSFGSDPLAVSTLAQAAADGLLAAGMQPVGKHAPGHGRAESDSHLGVPVIESGYDLAADVSVFLACNTLPWMMTAHVLYEAFDPALPATLSPAVIGAVIRDAIGFDGVLVSDDLAMGAMCGPVEERALAALMAGCDLALHCSGDLAENRAVLEAVPEVSPATLVRLERARMTALRSCQQLNRAELVAEQNALLR